MLGSFISRLITPVLPLVVLVAAACSGSSSSFSAGTTDAGAGHQAADATPPDGGGDASATLACSGGAARFGADVAPILKRCGGSEICHPSLDGTPWRLTALVNAPSVRDGCTPQSAVLVAPGHPEGSYLVNKLTGVGMCPESERMPRLGDPLPVSEIQTIVDWICAGAKDD